MQLGDFMQKEKRRPTLEELRALPVELWRLETAQIAVDAGLAGVTGIEIEADMLIDDPHLTPEKVVELRERLRCATGSTAIETVEPVARPDAA
jgi:NADPH-dependent 2,4-dienoyl-CoA reductase/sulfur reductase-like enzyme